MANNIHENCDHPYGICNCEPVTTEEYAKAVEFARIAAAGLADFDKEFSLS